MRKVTVNGHVHYPSLARLSRQFAETACKYVLTLISTKRQGRSQWVS